MRLTLVSESTSMNFYRKRCTIFAQVNCLGAELTFCLDALPERCGNRIGIGMDNGDARKTEKFSVTVSVHLAGRGVGLDGHAVQSSDHHSITGRFKNAAILRFSFTQLLFSLFVLCNVGVKASHTRELAGYVA